MSGSMCAAARGMEGVFGGVKVMVPKVYFIVQRGVEDCAISEELFPQVSIYT